MGERFLELKRKAFRIRLLKSILAAATAFFGCFGALALLSRYELLSIGRPLLWTISGAAFAAVWLVTFFLLRTSDRALAKRLDRRYGLQERVQTMLEYQNESDAIYELQRRDTEKALEKVSDQREAGQRLWVYALCLLLAAALFATSFVLRPAPEPPEEEVSAPFAITALQIAALEELVRYVNKSEMQSPYRENVAQAVTTLLQELKQATTEQERDAALSRAIGVIGTQTDASSAALELIDALWLCDSESAKLLAKALNYYDWPADAWETFDGQMADFRNTLVFTISPSEATLLFMTVGSHLMGAITQSGIPAEDGLCIALSRIAAANEENADGSHVYGLCTLSPLAELLWDADLQIELDETLAATSGALFTALSQHAANTGTGEYAITRICELFGHPVPKFERPHFREVSEEEEDGENAGEGVGGSVGGDAVFGSDDLVYDPIANEYVEYGTILERYAKLFRNWLDGNHTEQEKEAMEKYFDILKGGLKDEE
ncbi:MAG: hypothetical protein IKA05_09205 [Clostridia bacterium]|nr:hypothetical protein [Clostridia bacterium]